MSAPPTTRRHELRDLFRCILPHMRFLSTYFDEGATEGTNKRLQDEAGQLCERIERTIYELENKPMRLDRGDA